MGLLQQPAEQPRPPEFSFPEDEYCSVVKDWLTFGLPQQPFRQFAVPLDAPFVTEACCSMAADVSGLLQQLPELAALPFLVATHCLGTAEALGLLQQPLEHASPLPFGRALRRFSDPVLPPSRQESREARRILQEDSVERRSLPREEPLGCVQQDSCPRTIEARQIQPRASSLAAYLARVERRCWSHGLPLELLQAELGSSTVGR